MISSSSTGFTLSTWSPPSAFPLIDIAKGEIIKVNLSRNSIEELPVELSSCVSLQTLILSKNKVKHWPDSIMKSLSSLSCLKLDNNPLRQIPSDGFKAVHMLQILDLSGNAASLPNGPAFSNMPHLQELYLRKSAASMLSGKRPAQAAVCIPVFARMFLVSFAVSELLPELLKFQPVPKKGGFVKSGTNKVGDGGAQVKPSKSIEIPEDVEVN
ncbi:hypothetical protein K1719_017918 [Acacia pycnantha]|nr:hypothetical protein K1719_017918 [Acacia pycnantha]